jgi:CBS domain-containing protein
MARFFLLHAHKGATMLNLPISDIMNDHPIKVPADTTVQNVAHLMMRYRINGVLVMRADDLERLLGVFTTRDLMDILEEALSQGGHKMQALGWLGEQPVKDFVDVDPPSLQVTDNAAKAVVLMHMKDVITLPIFDGDKIVGVVGRHDIINIAFA